MTKTVLGTVRRVLLIALTIVPLAVTIALTGQEGHGAPAEGKLTVLDTAVGGAAELAGLAAGDFLISVAGTAVASLDDVKQTIARHEIGDSITVTVERNGQRRRFEVTVGAHEGHPSMGVALAVMSREGAAAFQRAQSDGLDRDGCLAWVDETYRLASVAALLDIELGERTARLRTCMRGDLDRMPRRIPRGWCDNVFKIHCSGLDLLTELGEAQVTFCASALEPSVGALATVEAWTTCAADAIFERLSVHGETSDAAQCRKALDDCGFVPRGDGARAREP